MSNNPTKFDEIMQWLKNQPFIAILLAIGVSVIALGSLAEALSKIQDFVAAPDVSVQTPNSAEIQQREEAVRVWIVDGQIEDRIRQTITKIAEDWFPDDTGLTWSIRKFSHKGFFTYVEVEPNSDSVGYERFVFVISFERKPADVIAVYALEDGIYELLATVKNLQLELPDALTDELQ